MGLIHNVNNKVSVDSQSIVPVCMSAVDYTYDMISKIFYRYPNHQSPKFLYSIENILV